MSYPSSDDEDGSPKHDMGDEDEDEDEEDDEELDVGGPDGEGVEEDEEEEEEEDPMDTQAVQEECLTKFKTKDYIMEPGACLTLRKYLQNSGPPEQLVELLSENYTAMAQKANLLAEWLILANLDFATVREMVEKGLKEMIIKHFDPIKADTIFTTAAGGTPEWLTQMVSVSTWRELVYALADEYPDCVFLNFTIKLISDAGYQGEITSMTTACHQLAVFTGILKSAINKFLEDPEEYMEKKLHDFTKMVCHTEQTYLYSLSMLHAHTLENKGGSVRLRILSQLIHDYAKRQGLPFTPISIALSGATAHQRVCQSVAAMLSKGALNPADVNVLHTQYSSSDPPPVDLLRLPLLLDLFIEALFKPTAKDRPVPKINPEYKSKYLYLLTYASCVHETYKKGVRKSVSTEDLKHTLQSLETAHKICLESKGSSDLLVHIVPLFQFIKYPVVARGLLTWIDVTVFEQNYFVHNTDHTPLHLNMLDEIVTCQTLLHPKIFVLLKRLFENTFDELDVLVQLELKKTILDRMIHLLWAGYVMPTIRYISACWGKQATDMSLIRYFITEALDVISPPYSSQFTQVFLPLIENKELTGSLRSDDESDAVSQFINDCATAS